MYENIKKIADYYGYESQSRQLIEEMAELTQAINKAWRSKYCGSSQEQVTEAIEKLIEEVADVEIMIDQIKVLLNCHSKVRQVKTRKIKRQLERMEREEQAV